ncbi:MAG: hypothetical protein IJY93_03635 [Clostridia bacterium]|nr:hypothetical protein [Clostridia bacterium]
MKKIKISSLLLTALMAFGLLSHAVSADDTVFTPAQGTVLLTPSVTDAIPSDNLFTSGDFDSSDCMTHFTTEGPDIEQISDENGGYIRVSGIPQSHYGVKYKPGDTVPAGKYLFTGYFRTLRAGEFTELRIIFSQATGTSSIAYAYPTNDWLKVEFYVELTDSLNYLKVCGGAPPVMIQDYCLDNFSLVSVDEIPENAVASFGTKVTAKEVEAILRTDISSQAWDPEAEAQYEVGGIILNQDFSGFLGAASTNGITPEEIKEFAYQYDGTHLTDYFISVNDVCAMFPNSNTTSYLDKYYWTEENGQTVDYTEQSQAKGSYYLYETLGTDPIGILTDCFEEIGINPWLSFRMNDVHDMSSMSTSIVFSEFYHSHPEIRRVQHHTYVGNFDKAMDYSYPLVRDYMLGFINETLNRYDIYGIELDFLRELWLWHIGGEYKGLDILNDFMRQVDDLVAVYEEKYGHKIHIATRVAYNLETNYDFGVDVVTWMAEGIVDTVIPASRWGTVDMDIPTKMWRSVTDMHNVELAVSMEVSRLQPYYGATNYDYMDIETMSAFAANAFSQGADKIYIFNYYRSSNVFYASEDKITTKSTYYGITSKEGSWNALTTLGSYDKLMTMNRRNIVTWKDMRAPWVKTIEYLPITFKNGSSASLHIPVGDIADGSTLTFKFSVSNSEPMNNPPTVYANSVECTYLGLDLCHEDFTEYMLMCYEIPEEAYNRDGYIFDGYILMEMTASESSETFKTDHAEIYIKAPQ